MPLDLFTDPNDEINVKIFVVPSKTKKLIYADVDVDKLKETTKGDADEADIEEHHAYFRTPSFGDTNKILDAAVKMKDNGVEIVPSELRQERISTLLLRWTFRGKDGLEMKPSRDNIRKLHPMIATIMGLELEYQLQQRGLL